MQKKNGVIRKAENRQVPSLVLEEKQSYSEEEDCVKYKLLQDTLNPLSMPPPLSQ